MRVLTYDTIVDIDKFIAGVRDIREKVTDFSHPHVHASVFGEPPLSKFQVVLIDNASEDDDAVVAAAVAGSKVAFGYWSEEMTDPSKRT